MSRWCLINYRCDADALSTSTVTERKDIRAQTGQLDRVIHGAAFALCHSVMSICALSARV